MQEFINIPDYWKSSVRPRGYAEICEMVDTQGRITGIWQIEQQDVKTGEIRQRIIGKNAVTDIGAQSILQRAINSSSATLPALFNNLLITNGTAVTTLSSSGAITANQGSTTTINVNALSAALPNSTPLMLGYGTATNQIVTVNNSGGYAQGYSGNVTVNAFTTDGTHSYAATTTAVVAQPQVTDNPASPTSNATTPLSSYSGNLPTNAFTFTPTTGAGNRLVSVTFTFTSAGGTATGDYTDCWIVNAASGVTTNGYICHETNVKTRCDSSNNIVATVTIRI